jgi:hypothetical protein
MAHSFIPSRTVVAAALLSLCGSASVLAADLPSNKDAEPPMAAPANNYLMPSFTVTKVEGFGGALAGDWPSKNWNGQFGGVASGVFEINKEYAFQVDAMLGSQTGAFVAGLTTHYYWFDTTKGLLGFYGSGEYRAQNSGESLLQLGIEGDYYLKQFTLSGIVGAETQANPRRGAPANSGYNGPTAFGCNQYYGCSLGAATPGGLYEMDDFYPHFFQQTRVFDHLEVDYYPIEDLKLSAAHEYSGGMNSAVLGSEYLFRNGSGTAPSVFTEVSLGEMGNDSALVGVRFYFGEEDKSLIHRQREDDPTTHMRRTLDTYSKLHSQRGPAMTSCTLGTIC